MTTVVWNLKIRLLHWLMALLIVSNLFIFDDGDSYHHWIGYAALVLLSCRLFIGLSTQGPEAFKNFNLQRSEIFKFIKITLALKTSEYSGHNPLASLTYLFFWVCVAGLGLTGILLVHVDAFFGDETVTSVHEILSYLVQFFLILHLSGLALDSYLHKRKAWMGMIHGRKD